MNTTTSPAELKLVNGATTITLRPKNANAGNPIHCREWNLGAPEVRVNSTPAPGSDGTYESPAYLGSRQVSFDLQIVGGVDENTGVSHDAYWYAEQLTAMSHPRALTYLEISRDGGTHAGKVFRMGLRGDPWTLPFNRRSAGLLELTLNFTCPLGLIEGPLQSVQTQPPSDTTGQWTFPAILPKDFGFSQAQNPLVDIAVGGTSPINPIVYISGPCKNPMVETDDNEIFAFSGLTLASGETVQIDMAAGTVLLGTRRDGADPDRSVYHLVDWSQSSFWTWAPGLHVVRYTANAGTATIQWRERQLSI